MTGDLMAMAERAVEAARRKGAAEVAAHASQGRSISVQYRDGELEQVHEAASTSLDVSLYVDGRYSSHTTSDLRPEALDAFLARAVAMTRLLAEDPFRGLADPAWYEGRSEADLQLEDPGYDALDVGRRKALAEAVATAARAAEGPILSVTAGYGDGISESARVHSNGFAGRRAGTRFAISAEVSVKDEGDRKPEEHHYAAARFLDDLPAPEEVGREAARRALSRLGQRKLPGGTRTLVLENRVAGRLLSTLVSALHGSGLYHRRSFLLDRQGQRVGSGLLTLVDEPLLPRGLGSRHYDADGLPTRRRVLFEGGILQQYLVDVYYGRKLGLKPEGGSTSNLIVPPGERSLDELVASVEDGILVTGLLGGNADMPTGDFSHGLVGHEIRHGRLAGPVGEMNVTGTHRELWERLVEVGRDPYPYGAWRVPALVFEGLAVSGA